MFTEVIFMSINKRINLLRKQLGMIQQDFANKIGVQRVTISWMEKEGNTITKQNIKIICDAFNVNENWLLNGEGDMFRPADEPDILDRLQQELKLTSQEMEIIRTFVELSPEQRRMGIEFVQTFTSKLSDVASALQEKKSQITLTVSPEDYKLFQEIKAEEAEQQASDCGSTVKEAKEIS